MSKEKALGKGKVADVFETLAAAVLDAVSYYDHVPEEVSGHCRGVVHSAAYATIDLLIQDARRYDQLAIWTLAQLNLKITELLEGIVLDERHSDEITSGLAPLKKLAETSPWWPVLFPRTGKSAGEEVVGKLDVGAAAILDSDSRASLRTPLNRLCLRLVNEIESKARLVERNGKVFEQAVKYVKTGELTPKEEKTLVEVFNERKRIGTPNKETAADFVNKVLIPFLLVVDPKLGGYPEVKQVLRGKRVRESGASASNFRTELSKYLVPALKKLV